MRRVAGLLDLRGPCRYHLIDMENKKIIIGILGGIGSGKSSVAAEFAKLGCAVIDADRIAHQLLDTEKIARQIRDAFGAEVFDADGRVNCSALGDRTFESSENVAKINDILHPEILIKCRQLIAEYNNADIKAIILDLPLLVEVGWDKKCDILIFIDCPERIRTQRTAKNGHLSKKLLKKRENFQISLDNKLKIAHYTINNHSDLSVLAEQVVRIFSIR